MGCAPTCRFLKKILFECILFECHVIFQDSTHNFFFFQLTGTVCDCDNLGKTWEAMEIKVTIRIVKKKIREESLVLNSSENVINIKRRIEQECVGINIKAEHMTLIFWGKILSCETQTLDESNVTNGSTLVVIKQAKVCNPLRMESILSFSLNEIKLIK